MTDSDWILGVRLAVGPALTTPWLRLGHKLLLAERLAYAAAYGWLALR